MYLTLAPIAQVVHLHLTVVAHSLDDIRKKILTRRYIFEDYSFTQLSVTAYKIIYRECLEQPHSYIIFLHILTIADKIPVVFTIYIDRKHLFYTMTVTLKGSRLQFAFFIHTTVIVPQF